MQAHYTSGKIVVDIPIDQSPTTAKRTGRLHMCTDSQKSNENSLQFISQVISSQVVRTVFSPTSLVITRGFN